MVPINSTDGGIYISSSVLYEKAYVLIFVILSGILILFKGEKANASCPMIFTFLSVGIELVVQAYSIVFVADSIRQLLRT